MSSQRAEHHRDCTWGRARVAGEWARKKAEKCGWSTGGFDVDLIESGGDGVSYRGPLWCGVPSRCPLCNRRVGRVRGAWLVDASERCLASGGAVAGGLLTIRHTRETPLTDMIDALLAGWKAIWTPAARRTAARKWGMVGAVRMLEATYGKNGWHPHTHWLAFLRRPLSEEETEEFSAWVFSRWREILTSRDLSALAHANQIEVTRDASKAAAYIAKGLALETVCGIDKSSGGLAPFQLLDANANLATGRRKALWFQWVDANAGRRSFGVTGKKALMEAGWIVEDLESDADASREAAREAAEQPLLARIPTGLWFALCRTGRRGHALRLAASREVYPGPWKQFRWLCAVDNPRDAGLESWVEGLDCIFRLDNVRSVA